MTSLQPSFYSPVPERPRDDLLLDYLSFLKARDGAIDPTAAYPNREAWLARADASPVRHRGKLDPELFSRSYARFQRAAAQDKALVALLAFVKINAGESYGVEVVSSKRHKGPPTGEPFDQAERAVSQEETYHTRILLGATAQFDLPRPQGAWRPPLPLKVLIGSLAYSPKAFFHPIVLGAEISGVYLFQWLLGKVGEVFKDEPDLKEEMEARLVEVLIDEIGHIAFNRMAVGPWGLSAGHRLAARIAAAMNASSPEFSALGWTEETTRALGSFDLANVPDEVRRRSFFV